MNLGYWCFCKSIKNISPCATQTNNGDFHPFDEPIYFINACSASISVAILKYAIFILNDYGVG